MWFARRQKAPYVRSMTLRSPHSHSSVRETALDYEIVQEQAVALGRLGRALEVALASLSGFDRAQAERGEDPKARTALRRSTRERLVQEAGHALWCFIVQREACGLRDQRLIVREYAIPAEVQNRMGVFGGGNSCTS